MLVFFCTKERDILEMIQYIPLKNMINISVLINNRHSVSIAYFLSSASCLIGKYRL